MKSLLGKLIFIAMFSFIIVIFISDALKLPWLDEAFKQTNRVIETHTPAPIKKKFLPKHADIGLIEPSQRSEHNYRLYDERDIRKLGFVRRARAFGFSVEQCRELLSLYEDDGRESGEVREIASKRLSEIKILMKDLKVMHDELDHLVNMCQGGTRPNCPILQAFSGKGL